jgi:shikimate kinase
VRKDAIGQTIVIQGSQYPAIDTKNVTTQIAVNNGDTRTRLDELYAQRDALYREVADHVVDAVRENVFRFVRILDSDTQHA